MFYLFFGFAAVWFFVTLYLIYIGLRQRHMEDEMRMLREEIEGQRKA